MYTTLGKFIAASALIGTLAVVGATPSQAAQGRNAAFAAGVGAGLLGGAVLGSGYGYGGSPAYGGYYGGPRYAYGAYGYHRPYRHRYYRHW